MRTVSSVTLAHAVCASDSSEPPKIRLRLSSASLSQAAQWPLFASLISSQLAQRTACRRRTRFVLCVKFVAVTAGILQHPWAKVFPVNTKERLTRTRSSNAVRSPKRSRAEQSCYTSSCHKDSHDRGRAKRKIFRTFDVDVLCERRESMRRRH
jgi:hypothetical protein